MSKSKSKSKSKPKSKRVRKPKALKTSVKEPKKEPKKTQVSAKRRNTLNSHELKILLALKSGESRSIEDLAKGCFPSLGSAPDKKGNSWVRNGLRRLVSNSLIKKTGRGSYETTARGKAADEETKVDPIVRTASEPKVKKVSTQKNGASERAPSEKASSAKSPNEDSASA